MIFKDTGYENSSELWVREGYINICFEDQNSALTEAFHATLSTKNKKRDSIDIYIRNKLEGHGTDINHHATVKASIANSRDKQLVPYSVPTKDGDTCKKDVNGYDSFNTKYGSRIKSFVEDNSDLITKYWNADPKDLDKIKSEFQNKYQLDKTVRIK